MLPADVVQRGHALIQTADLPAMLDYAQKEVVMRGYPVQQFLLQFMEMLLHDPTLSSTKKAMLALRLSQTDHLLHDGADELLQLYSLLNYCQQISNSTTCPAFTHQ